MKRKEKTEKKTRPGVAELKKQTRSSVIELKKKKETEAAATIVRNDRDCPFHGNLKARGRIFEGRVAKKFPNRVAIEFERMVYVRKYERYSKSKTKIHARLPVCMEKDINVGDLIRVQECRPLSKIIHFVVIKKIKGSEEGDKK